MFPSVNSLALKHHGKILLIVLLGLTLSVVLSMQKSWYTSLENHNGAKDKFEALLVKKNNLLDDLSQFPAESHKAKGVYRLTVPLTMKVFDIDNAMGLYKFQILLGIIMYFLLGYILFSASNSYLITALSLVLIGGTYFGKSYYTDAFLWTDIFGYFLIVFCIAVRKVPILLFLGTIALFFTDERGMLSVSIVYLTILVLSLDKHEKLNIKHFLKFNKPQVFLIAAFALSLAFRIYLQVFQNLKTPSDEVGYSVFVAQWQSLQLGYFYGLGAVFGLFALTVVHAVNSKHWMFAISMLCIIVLFIVIASLVHDITRSAAYLVPLTIVCIKYLSDNFPGLAYTLVPLIAINALVPAGFVIKNDINGNRSYSILFDIWFKLASVVRNILG